MNNENQHIGLIIKHLSGDISATEERALNDWLNENEHNKQQFNDTKAAWELSHKKLDTEVTTINLNDEWSKLSSIINFEEKNNIIDFNRRENKSSFNWMKIAAAIAILITIGGGWFFLSQPDEISLIAENKIIEKELSDGSNIILKEKSNLVYNEEYNQSVRKVILEGEAYFNVEPDKTKPFIVEAGNIIIKVVGTSFLVKNIEKKMLSEVIVNSGKIIVYNSQNKKDSLILKAGEKASFSHKTSNIAKSQNLDQNYMAWKTKNFNFDKTSLNQVVETINHAYNCNIVLKNKKLNNCILTVSLENQSLESILKVLEATLSIKIYKKGKKIEISGEGCENIPKK